MLLRFTQTALANNYPNMAWNIIHAQNSTKDQLNGLPSKNSLALRFSCARMVLMLPENIRQEVVVFAVESNLTPRWDPDFKNVDSANKALCFPEYQCLGSKLEEHILMYLFDSMSRSERNSIRLFKPETEISSKFLELCSDEMKDLFRIEAELFSL